MRIAGIIMRAEVVLPPSAGPARAEHCVAEGVLSLRKAGHLLGTAWMTTAPLLAAAERAPHDSTPPPPRWREVDLQARAHFERVQYWRSRRHELSQWRDRAGEISPL